MTRRAFPALCAALLCVMPARAADPVAPKRTEDVIYGRKYGMALTMDVFTPDRPNGAGVIIAVSGGWISAKEAVNPLIAAPLTSRGYTVFAVVHGSQPRFTIPEIVDDMNRAVRFIRHNSKRFGIDPERLGMTGASAGGHLSLMLGTAGTPGDPKAKDPIDRLSSRIQAVACFFPPTDFLNWGAEGKYLKPREFQPKFNSPFDFQEFNRQKGLFEPITDEKQLRDIMTRISPITHVSSDDPPVLISHGDKDELVPLQQSEVFIKKLQGVKVPCELIVRKGAKHGGIEFLPDPNRFADWFDKHLASKDAARAEKP